MSFTVAIFAMLFGSMASVHATAVEVNDQAPHLTQVRTCRQMTVESSSRSFFRNAKSVSGYGIEEVLGSGDYELVILLVDKSGNTVKEVSVANSLTKEDCLRNASSCN